MTITTGNTNPKNDSKYARHRSITKGNQNVLQDVIAALKRPNDVQYREFASNPNDIRQKWNEKFNRNGLPGTDSDQRRWTGTSGVYEWLGGAASPFVNDLQTIWGDFFKIWVRRSDGNTQQVLFLSHTATQFDLIYSKWGLQSGHRFFHWQSVVGAPPPGLAAAFADADDSGDENDM